MPMGIMTEAFSGPEIVSDFMMEERETGNG